MPGRVTVMAFQPSNQVSRGLKFTHLSSNKARQNHGSNCCSSCIDYHNDTQGVQPLEVQSICPCMIQRCWSRGSPITLQDTRSNGNGIGRWVMSSWRGGWAGGAESGDAVRLKLSSLAPSPAGYGPWAGR